MTAIERKLEQLNQRLLNSSQTLHAVSPLATLNRGYAMAIHQPTGKIIRSTEQLSHRRYGSNPPRTRPVHQPN